VKKVLSLMVMSLFMFLPFVANAASEMKFSCTDPNSEGIRECQIFYNIDATTPQEKVQVTLTEHGGAEIQAPIEAIGDTFFIDGTPAEVNNVWTVNMNSLNQVTGENELFKFKYKTSGESDCKVSISIGNITKEIITETKAENPKTGSTLPYITLGSIAIISVAAYMSLKNKTKIHNI